MQKQLMAMSSGKVIYPFADDCDPCLHHFDKAMMRYKNKVAVIGWHSRIAFTRLAYDTVPEINSFGKTIVGRWGDDEKIKRFAVSNKFYYDIPKPFQKVQPRDKTNDEGAMRGWNLKDLSLLDSPIVEVGI
jgi:hypothetical protein